jgi:hypothetical protein
VPPFLTLFFFGQAYAFAVALTSLFIGQRRDSYFLLLLMIMAGYLYMSPYLALSLIAIAAIFSAIALRVTLNGFPWLNTDGTERPHPLNQLITGDELLTGDTRMMRAGWPFAALGPEPAFRKAEFEDGLWIGLLIGFAYFVANAYATMFGGDLSELVIFYWLPIGMVTMIRLFIYLSGTATPISLVGRVMNREFVVVKWDNVLLTPVAAILVGRYAPALLLMLEVPRNLASSVSLALTIMILVNGGPTLRRWKLTGAMRLVQPRTPQGNSSHLRLR